MSIEAPKILLRLVDFEPNDPDWVQKALVAHLLDSAVTIEFSEEEPSTVPIDPSRERVHSFGYVSTAAVMNPPRLVGYGSKIARAYLDSKKYWAQLGERAAPRRTGERWAEYFITGPDLTADCHCDTFPTAAFYLHKGAVLLAAHDTDVHDMDDFQRSGTTAALPAAGTFAYFKGMRHAHRAGNLYIDEDDPLEVQVEKFLAMLRENNVERIVHNHAIDVPTECDPRELTYHQIALLAGALVAPKWLQGYRVVGSFNFSDSDNVSSGSSLDEFFAKAIQRGTKTWPSAWPIWHENSRGDMN